MLRKCFVLFIFVAITTEFVRSEEEACWEKCLQVFTNFKVLLLQDCFKTHHTSQGLLQNFGPSIFQCMFYVAKIQLLNFPEMACSIFENGVSCSLKPCKGFFTSVVVYIGAVLYLFHAFLSIRVCFILCINVLPPKPSKIVTTLMSSQCFALSLIHYWFVCKTIQFNQFFILSFAVYQKDKLKNLELL